MDSLLSQDEIDSLLAQAAGDGSEELEGALAEMVSEQAPDDPAEVRAFDFRRPYSISHNFEKNLRSICDNLAKSATVHFTNQLRTNCVLEFRRLILQTFGEYAAGLPNPTCISVVTLAPLKGSALFYLDLSLSFAMIKKLLGGPAEAETRNREYTEIELSIVRSMIMKFMDLLRGAAGRLVEFDPHCVTVENNPNYLNSLAPGDSVVVLDCHFHLENVEGRLNFCIPIAGFEPVRVLFDPEESLEPRPAVEVRRDRALVLDLVGGTDVEAVAKLGELQLSMEQIMALEEGQVLTLDKPIDAPLALVVEGKPLWLGAAGRVHQHRALRLTERLSEE
jgi:flagellar motor switch protein FliM